MIPRLLGNICIFKDSVCVCVCVFYEPGQVHEYSSLATDSTSKETWFNIQYR